MARPRQRGDMQAGVVSIPEIPTASPAHLPLFQGRRISAGEPGWRLSPTLLLVLQEEHLLPEALALTPGDAAGLR